MATDAMAHRFGRVPGFPLGVEEELLLVDPATGRLVSNAETVIAAARPPRGRLASEIFASQVELITPTCRHVSEVADALHDLLQAVKVTGVSVIGAGLHPCARDGEARLSDSPRYAQVSESLRGLLRTPPAALHVHVGMPDPETAIRVANRLRLHLPLLHSLGANSPYWFGRDSGLASARAAVLRSYPRIGVPRWFRDWQDFCQVAAELAQAAGVPDYTFFWWDVRPHPQLGTVEVRAPDAQFNVGRTLALAAFIHALARMEAEEPPPEFESRDAIEEGCYQASRYGLEAQLPDHRGSRRPARQLARELIKRVRPYARELACEDSLLDLEEILHDGGADAQRRIASREGMDGLLRWLMSCR